MWKPRIEWLMILFFNLRDLHMTENQEYLFIVTGFLCLNLVTYVGLSCLD